MSQAGGYIAVYVDSDIFTVSGDKTSVFHAGRRCRYNMDVDGLGYGTVLSSSFSSPNTTVNLTTDSDDLTSNLCTVKVSLTSVGSGGNIPGHQHSGTGEGVGGNTLDSTKLINALTLGNGSTASGTLTLSLADGQGDCYVAAGKTDFTNTESGFILGIDDSDNNKAKFYLGDSSENLYWNGSNLFLTGSITCSGGTIGGFTISSTTLANGTDIILDASNKAISINDATYGNQGIQLQYNGGTPRFYCGNGVTKYLEFDGTDIKVSSSQILAGALLDSLTLGNASNPGTLTLTTGIGLGDSYINCGKTAFDNTQNGFILGLEDDSGQTAKFYIGNTTDYLNWTGSDLVISVSSANAITIKSGGDMKLEAAAANPALIKFEGTQFTTTFGPDTVASGGTIILKPESTDDDGDIILRIGSINNLRFSNIILDSKNGINLRAYEDANIAASIEIDQDATNAFIEFETKYSGAKYCRMLHSSTVLAFYPTTNNEWDLGASSTKWKDFYAVTATLSSTGGVLIRASGTIKPNSMADASAENDSIYYSTDQSKLVYKDSGGTVRDLY